MADKKQQHINPFFNLNKWAKESRVQQFDLQTDLIHSAHPKTILRESNFYTLPILEEQKLIIEEFFSEIETNAAPSINKIISGQRINDEERLNIAWFIASQRVRTHYLRNLVEEVEKAFATAHLKNVSTNPKNQKKLEEILHTHNAPEDLVERFRKEPQKAIDQMLGGLDLKISNIKDVWLSVMVGNLERLGGDYNSGSWLVVRAPQKRGFITSDNGVTTLTFAGNLTEVTVPLDPQTCLIINPGERKELIYAKHDQDPQEVRELNVRTLIHAERYIIAQDNRLAHSLVKKYKYLRELLHDNRYRRIQEIAQNQEVIDGPQFNFDGSFPFTFIHRAVN